jgi:hypothetical protein
MNNFSFLGQAAFEFGGMKGSGSPIREEKYQTPSFFASLVMYEGNI